MKLPPATNRTDGQWTMDTLTVVELFAAVARRVKTFEQRNKYSTLKNYKLQRSFPYRKCERRKLLKFHEKIFHFQWKFNKDRQLF